MVTHFRKFVFFKAKVKAKVQMEEMKGVKKKKTCHRIQAVLHPHSHKTKPCIQGCLEWNFLSLLLSLFYEYTSIIQFILSSH